MNEDEAILSVECDEPEGLVTRNVRFAPLTSSKLVYYGEKLSQFPTLFNRFVPRIEDFLTSFITSDGNGGMKANGLLWEVDDVGLFFMTDIYPGYQATGHFTFWDRRFRGRESLVQEMLKYVFEEFGFLRIVAEVPLYSQPTMAAVERVGFVKEGRLRKATWYNGQWWDVNIYSVLKDEVLNDGILEA
jgi:RimJ/RimL family protein N-acetyltransferase